MVPEKVSGCSLLFDGGHGEQRSADSVKYKVEYLDSFEIIKYAVFIWIHKPSPLHFMFSKPSCMSGSMSMSMGVVPVNVICVLSWI